MMKTIVFIAFFLVFGLSGCSSTSSINTPQQQDFNRTEGAGRMSYGGIGNTQIGQMGYEMGGTGQNGRALQMGNTTGIANTGWPGAVSDSDTGIKLLSVRTPVRQGEKGNLSIQGVPGTNYTVTATYNNTRGSVTAMAASRAGSDGRVGWTWNVRNDTLPGTYNLVISGGGKMTSASYTVTQ